MRRRQRPARLWAVARPAGVPIYWRVTGVEFMDGTIEPGLWTLRTTDLDAVGFVPCPQVLTVLGYQPDSYLRGFNGGKGIMRLHEEQAAALMAAFKALHLRRSK